MDNLKLTRDLFFRSFVQSVSLRGAICKYFCFESLVGAYKLVLVVLSRVSHLYMMVGVNLSVINLLFQ